MPRLGRGRGRRGGRGAQETHQTQDYSYTPPLRLRYPTRSSTVLAPQLFPLPSLGSITYKRALRTLKEDRVTPKPEFPSCSSQPNGNGPVSENSVEDWKPSTYTGSPNILGPFTQQEIELDGLSTKITSQTKGGSQPPSHQVVDGDSQPPRENSELPRHYLVMEKCKTTDGPWSSQRLSPTHSLNLTEFARGLQQDSDDDPDEVESAPDHDYVHGHKVKKEIAGLVGEIFTKYGDITRESDVKSPTIISFFLQGICNVYQKLEQSKLLELKSAEINAMLEDLRHYEKEKLNVGWLLEKLEQISEAKSSFKKYLMVNGEKEKYIESNRRLGKDLEQNRLHIAMIQKKISATEQEMVDNQAKADECTKMAIDIKIKVKALANQSLVHGLL